jgi:hypothetical protein
LGFSFYKSVFFVKNNQLDRIVSRLTGKTTKTGETVCFLAQCTVPARPFAAYKRRQPPSSKKTGHRSRDHERPNSESYFGVYRSPNSLNQLNSRIAIILTYLMKRKQRPITHWQYEELIINAILLNELKLTYHANASKADEHLNLF